MSHYDSVFVSYFISYCLTIVWTFGFIFPRSDRVYLNSNIADEVTFLVSATSTHQSLNGKNNRISVIHDERPPFRPCTIGLLTACIGESAQDWTISKR